MDILLLMIGHITKTMANIESGGYENEYQFQFDLYQTFPLAHDRHFLFYPDLLTKPLDFRRKVSLASISKDGWRGVGRGVWPEVKVDEREE